MLTVENFTRSKVREAIADFTHKDKVIFAAYCAELVIDIYENKNDSKAPRLAIEATKEWIKDPTEKNKKKCINAADAVHAADAACAAVFYADDAACATACAAAYAACAAYAAANAAYAAIYAANAAYAAIYAADAATIKTKIINKINEMKERHDQQVDSADSYVSKDQLNEFFESNVDGTRLAGTDEAYKLLDDNLVFVGDQPYTPQVGEECEFQSFIGNDWIKGVLIASTESYAILKSDKREHSFIKENVNFRPLKTERDKLLEHAVSNFSESELAIEENIKATCYRLIDAGWRPTND